MDNRLHEAQRDMLIQAAGVLGTFAAQRDLGAVDDVAALRAAREFLEKPRSPYGGEVPAAEVGAIEAERTWVLGVIDAALAGKGVASGLGPLTWAERQVLARVWPLVMDR